MASSALHAFVLVGAITALRIAALYFSAADLGPDETQYWVWAQEPALGYFSKPPLIAWIIGAATALCGDGEACVRLPAPLIHGATALTLFFVARALYDARIGLLSAAAYATLPGVSLSAGIISTDVPLLFFWALALYALVRGMRSPSFIAALLLGVSVGLGLLAKYAMAYFLVSAGLALFAVPRARRFLISARGALALLAGFSILAPNLVWNVNNGLATLKHTAANAGFGGALVHPGALAEFLLAQAGIFGPIFFAMLLVGLVMRGELRAAAALSNEGEAARLLVSFTLPTLVIVSVVAFLSRAHGNWAAAAYVAATPLAIHWLVDAQRKSLLRLSFALHVFVAAMLPVGLAVPALADAAGLGNALKRVRGWEALGQAVAARLEGQGYTAILAAERELMGELLYYVKPRQVPVVMWDWARPPRNHYELSMRIGAATGRRVLFVTTIQGLNEVLARFDTVTPLGEITVALDARRFRTAYLFALEGFHAQGP